MNKVYKHQPLARDEYLGRVDAEGRVYEGRFGPDRYIGRVELDSGKVFLDKLGPDEYLGKVTSEGKLYRHKPLTLDDYLGRIDEMVSIAHGGAAFLLLVAPAYAQQPADDQKNETAKGTPDKGAAPAKT